MSLDVNYYHCNLPTDMSMYDHLPYHVNPTLCDGTHISMNSGNIIRGCLIDKENIKLIVPAEFDASGQDDTVQDSALQDDSLQNEALSEDLAQDDFTENDSLQDRSTNDD